MKSSRIVPLFVALSLWSTAAERAAPRQDPTPQDKLVVLEPGTVRLLDLIETTARFLGRNHLVPSESKAGSVEIELQNRMSLNARSCESVFSQLLDSAGFAYVPLDPDQGLWEIVNLSNSRRWKAETSALYLEPDEVLQRRNARIVAQTTVHLTNLDPHRTTSSMRPFLHTSGPNHVSITSVGNSLMLRGCCDDLAKTIESLRAIDRQATAAPEEGSANSQKQRVLKLAARLQGVETQLSQLRPQARPARPGVPEKRRDRD